MQLSKTTERLGLTLLRWGTRRPIMLIQPPSWTIQYLKPIPPADPSDLLRPVGRLGAWMIKRANPLAHIQPSVCAIKVTLP